MDGFHLTSRAQRFLIAAEKIAPVVRDWAKQPGCGICYELKVDTCSLLS